MDDLTGFAGVRSRLTRVASWRQGAEASAGLCSLSPLSKPCKVPWGKCDWCLCIFWTFQKTEAKWSLLRRAAALDPSHRGPCWVWGRSGRADNTHEASCCGEDAAFDGIKKVFFSLSTSYKTNEQPKNPKLLAMVPAWSMLG